MCSLHARLQEHKPGNMTEQSQQKWDGFVLTKTRQGRRQGRRYASHDEGTGGKVPLQSHGKSVWAGVEISERFGGGKMTLKQG
jgi:hypothetical protein